MKRCLHKLTTWLVLVVYVLSGVSPAQQLVVCLEPDGSVVLEAAEPSGCTPCGVPEDSSGDVESLGVECCPCIDIPLPTQSEEPQAKLKASEGHGSWAAVVPPSFIAEIARVEPTEPAVSARSQPRPAPGLALIRTVILRV